MHNMAITRQRKDHFAYVEELSKTIRAKFKRDMSEGMKTIWKDHHLRGFEDADLIGTLKAKLAMSLEKIEELKEKQAILLKKIKSF